MSLRWIDGFEAYQGNIITIPRKYAFSTTNIGTSIFVSSVALGRLGSALQFTGTTLNTPTFTSQTTWTVGFAFLNVNLTGTNNILTFNDGVTAQITLQFNAATGLFSVLRNGVSLGTGTHPVFGAVFFHYIELQVKVDPSAGTVNLHVGQASDISISGLNTQVSGSSSANNFTFLGNGTTSYIIDDVYILDNQGSVNNTFLGDVKVEAMTVSLQGTNTNWTPPAGSIAIANFLEVQKLFDGLTISTTATSIGDTYRLSPLQHLNSSIAGIMVNISAANSDSNTHNLAPLVRQGGINYTGSMQTINDTVFKFYTTIYEQDPNSVAAWTIPGTTSVEIGQTT